MSEPSELPTPIAAAANPPPRTVAHPPSLWRQPALRRFLRHRLAVAGTLFLLALCIITFPLAPVVTQGNPNRVDLRAVSQPPSWQHPLGTDMAGRDVWSRLIYGGRISLAVGLVAVLIYLTIGIVLGSIAGYVGGTVDAVIMRITDTVMAFPGLIILIAIVALIGPGLFNTMLAIGLMGWTGVARLVRGQILSLRAMDFVVAAQGVGVAMPGVIVRHLLPNVVPQILIAASFGIAGSILSEAGLSFLGLGVQIPTPSWGNMLNAAQSIQIIERMPWLWLPPGLLITLCVLAINFIGDGLRDALDPRMSHKA